MKYLVVRCGLALGLAAFGLPASVRAEAPAAVAPQALSPAEMLNPDGTLKLAPDVSGALDLSGWAVTLDPARGPVFEAADPASELEAVAAAPVGEWAALGAGGGAVDSYVHAIVVLGSDVYVGGSFTDIASIPEADYVARWDGTQWSALSGNGAGDGSLSNEVRALALSGTTLYAGGSFAYVYDGSGVSVSGAAYVARWDGAHWTGLGSNGAGGRALNSGVQALAVSGSDVYAGGYFTNVNNSGTILTSADYVAKWDGANWSALGSNGAGEGSLNSSPYALALLGSTLYVGGPFTNVNDNGTVLDAADYVAAWDGANWSALGSNGAGNGSITGGYVYDLAVSGSTLYVGGEFTNVNDNGAVLGAADYIAAWDGSHWSALGPNGALNGAVQAILVSGTTLYVGGRFTNVNDNGAVLDAADYIVAWDGSHWSALGSNGSGGGVIPVKADPSVIAVGVVGGQILIGGAFYDLNDGGAILPQADFLAGWDGAHWSALGNEPNGALVNGYASARVLAILVHGNDVYVGGDFDDVSNQGINLTAADNVAKWDGINWSALGSNGAGDGAIRGAVQTLAWISPYLYVGGLFTNVNNNGTVLGAADRVARFDGANWSALGSNGAGNGALTGSVAVEAFGVSGGILYVGGNFTDVNNNGVVLTAADRIARWDGANWSALGSNGAGDGSLVNSGVTAITVVGSTVYVGGYFTDVNNGGTILNAADYIAAWDGDNWSALGDDGAGGGSLNNGVNDIAVAGTTLYIGGSFTDINNHGAVLPAGDYIATWDGADWAALGNGLDGALGGQVTAIVVDGSGVYVGGWFSNVRNASVLLPAADYAARWDGADWTALSSPTQSIGALPDLVETLAIQGTDLLIGGYFTNVRRLGTEPIKEADYVVAFGLPVAAPPPAVATVARASVSPIGDELVHYIVEFSKQVTGVDTEDFAVTMSGLSGASIHSVSGSGTTYTVMVSTGIGSGTLRLDVVDDDTIVDSASQPLGGLGNGNGGFTTGEAFTIDKALPTVASITRASPNPTRADAVNFVVTFSESVSDVDVTDFAVVAEGLAGAAITTVSGSGTTYTVAVSTGVGQGTVRLDLVDDDTIRDGALNRLGGVGASNGDYATGEAYDVRSRWLYLPAVARP